MTDRKKPGLAFWTTVVAVVVLAYPLSMGPACWASSRVGIGVELVSAAYKPLFKNTPLWVADWLERYARLGAAQNWVWRHLGSIPTDDPEWHRLGTVFFWGPDF
jgi:hypothetical protein